jgi:hypothetical protein
MCLSRTNPITGKVETVSTETRCDRCEILERELSKTEAARAEAMGRVRVLEDHLQAARASEAELQRKLDKRHA